MSTRSTRQLDIDFQVEAALAFHDEDAKATIATLLCDIRALRTQLELTKAAMSRNMSRGSLPNVDRGL